MAEQQQAQNYVPSKAAVRGHPIHPMLVPFPIAGLVGALVTDITYAATRNVFWAEMSFWLIVGSVATGLLAAVFGFADFFSISRVRRLTAGRVHMAGNLAAVVLSLINALARRGDPAGALMPLGLTMSVIVVVILSVTGWLGGELAYRCLVGVNPDWAQLAAAEPVAGAAARRKAA